MYIDIERFRCITDSDRGIKLSWIGNKKDALYKEHGYHTGIDIYAGNVYSYASGVVTSISMDKNYYAVTVQYNAFVSLRYLHLESVSVSAGQPIQQGFKIGNADKYVHFEYVTKKQGDSLWAVRIGTETYYKHNPMNMIGG
ncbi:MAG: peptidoglycan DD-metalloendopeptidase family protein [Lachnospiraceae bacterium]|nr:peptidoglycan DD-metalloendopeptidase family protein [Lachnospiraceae bacterium]MCM1232032.1 peptidoglycan DD-metalloendopeptidase family protein [Ruminococcus flavefaciens]